MAEKRQWRNLKPPPKQTIRGVILYHDAPTVDKKIRLVRELREDYGYDVGDIATGLEFSLSQVYAYLAQIREARHAYIEAFPDEFQCGTVALVNALERRQTLDQRLRKELGSLDPKANPSNRVGYLKLIMRNMREWEELQGLLVARVEHGGEIAVKDRIQALLDRAPAPVRERYLDALSAVLAAAESTSTTDGPGSP